MDRSWTRRGLAALAAGALLATACGGDDGTADDGGSEGASGATPTAFCDAAIEGEATFNVGPELDDEGNPTDEGMAAFGEQLTPLLDQMESEAPEEVASEVGTVVTAVRQAVDSGDPSGTEEPAFMEADAAIDAYVFDNCDLAATHTITAVEYGYEGVPDTVEAGQVGFQLENGGEEVHEAVLFRINDGVEESAAELLQLPEGEVESKASFVGAAFAAPGDQASTVVDLEAGRYAFVCFVPVGTTSMEDAFSEEGAGGPPHFTEGMVAEFEVS